MILMNKGVYKHEYYISIQDAYDAFISESLADLALRLGATIRLRGARSPRRGLHVHQKKSGLAMRESNSFEQVSLKYPKSREEM
jgi:hypothetical protein